MTASTINERLLIISCSQRKRRQKAPAWDLYDGVAFRMLRKIEREANLSDSVEILIISSKYGLIASSQVIEYYDECLTQQRAQDLKSDVERDLKDFLIDYKPREVFCCLGQRYRELVEETLASSGIPYSNAVGRIGEKLAETRRWIST